MVPPVSDAEHWAARGFLHFTATVALSPAHTAGPIPLPEALAELQAGVRSHCSDSKAPGRYSRLRSFLLLGIRLTLQTSFARKVFVPPPPKKKITALWEK